MLCLKLVEFYFFFFQAEDGIRDVAVTGVQTCALPICRFEGVAHDLVWSASRRDIVAEGQFQPDEILKYSRNAGTPRCEIDLPKIHTVDLNPAGLRVVEPTE